MDQGKPRGVSRLFSLVSLETPLLGRFVWMPHSAHEGKRLWFETDKHEGQLDYVLMDSKANDSALFRELRRQRKMTLLTVCRKTMDKTPHRKAMIEVMAQPEHKALYKKRSTPVKPMQGLVKEIFSLARCWMRGTQNNRWLFATMGLLVQRHPLKAWRQKRSTWKIKQDVLEI